MTLPDYRLKLQRAKHHITEMEKVIKDWEASKPYSVIDEVDPEVDEPYPRRIRVEIHRQVPSTELALIVGDALVNLRATFDYLALEVNGGVSCPTPRKSAFPIIGHVDGVKGEEEFDRQAKRRLEYASEDVKKAMKAVQPYHWGPRYQNHFFWQLEELCNQDKHRMLHPVAVAHNGHFLNADRPEAGYYEDMFEKGLGVLRDDGVVFWYWTETPLPETNPVPWYMPIVTVGFRDNPVVGMPMVQLMRRIVNELEGSVIHSLEKILGRGP